MYSLLNVFLIFTSHISRDYFNWCISKNNKLFSRSSHVSWYISTQSLHVTTFAVLLMQMLMQIQRRPCKQNPTWTVSDLFDALIQWVWVRTGGWLHREVVMRHCMALWHLTSCTSQHHLHLHSTLTHIHTQSHTLTHSHTHQSSEAFRQPSITDKHISRL